MSNETNEPRRLVLLVDDSPETLTALVEALEAASLTALVARDGLSALGLLDRVKPDLVLMDAVMPGIDGFETCRRIKKIPSMALTPVIFMTGLSEREHVIAGLEAGGVDYVTKPIDQQELLARIRIHLTNADFVQEARDAIDMTGPGVISIGRHCEVQWASRRAESCLGQSLANVPERGRSAISIWLAETAAQPLSECRPLDMRLDDGRLARLQVIARPASGDTLVCVAVQENSKDSEVLSKKLSISQREGEVLSWLAKGKSNKDIAQILELSPRTVTKHIENILEKLGAENRTSAAIIALKLLMS
jgi:DNA-binding NarL/FixJ family response regulator